MGVHTFYGDIKVGDVVMDHGTWFQVVSEPRSWQAQGKVWVWAFDAAAISEPTLSLRGFVNEPGDEWQFQIRADLAFTEVYASLAPKVEPVDLTEFSRELGKRFLSF